MKRTSAIRGIPFTRGLHPLGYRSRAWTTRQYTGFGTPEETNERFKLMISHGQTGLNVAFDLPTQMGYDSDDPLAEGEVGRVGMAVDSLRDFEIAFKDIPLDQIGVGLTINAVATIMLAMFQSMAEKFGYPKDQISATPQNDILKEMIGRGAWIFPVDPAVRLVGDTIEYSIRQLPSCNPVSVCGYHIRESGATPAQEIAYAILIANAYIDEVRPRARGRSVRRPFFLQLKHLRQPLGTGSQVPGRPQALGPNLKEKYGVKNDKNMYLRGLFGGGGCGLTKAQPENNIIRGAFYALAAALGGAQTTALCSFDEAYTIPTPRAALLSLRTLEILMEEVGLRDTVDPLAGSYFIETLTKQMEEKILAEMKEVEKIGGMRHAVATGYIQRKVSRQAYEFEKALQDGSYVKVGVNKYTDGDENPPDVDLHDHDESGGRTDAGFRELRRTRDNREVTRTLKALESGTRAGKETSCPTWWTAAGPIARWGK